MKNKQNKIMTIATRKTKSYCWLEDTPWVSSKEALDLTLRHDASPLITEVYQDIGLKHFMHTLRMPQIYLYSLPLDCELCAFLILQLYRSMLKHSIDKECACPLGFLFAQKQA